MSKRIARVDILIDASIGHIAHINNILRALKSADMQPSEEQKRDINTLITAVDNCNELLQRRYVAPSGPKIAKTYKHAKLTSDEINDYINGITARITPLQSKL
jgi:hypothetical protein